MLLPYVDSVEQHLPEASRRRRWNALRDQLQALKVDLESLKSAFDPLKIKLDISAPDISDSIEHYVETRQAKIVSAELADILTESELKDLLQSAKRNSQTLDQAIKDLRAYIKDKYPNMS